MGVFRWELGKKTSKANAALAGIGRTRRIIIADTMLDQYSDDEIEVVLAHELAHHVYRDIWTGIACETALTLVGFYVAHRVLAWIGPRAGLTSPADPDRCSCSAVAANFSVQSRPLRVRSRAWPSSIRSCRR